MTTPAPAFRSVFDGILWAHTEPIDPEWWRQMEVALDTGDFESIITARLTEIGYVGLP